MGEKLCQHFYLYNLLGYMTNLHQNGKIFCDMDVIISLYLECHSALEICIVLAGWL